MKCRRYHQPGNSGLNNRPNTEASFNTRKNEDTVQSERLGIGHTMLVVFMMGLLQYLSWVSCQTKFVSGNFQQTRHPSQSVPPSRLGNP